MSFLHKFGPCKHIRTTILNVTLGCCFITKTKSTVDHLLNCFPTWLIMFSYSGTAASHIAHPLVIVIIWVRWYFYMLSNYTHYNTIHYQSLTSTVSTGMELIYKNIQRNLINFLLAIISNFVLNPISNEVIIIIRQKN